MPLKPIMRTYLRLISRAERGGLLFSKEFLAIRDLKDGWFGEGSRAPDPRTIVNAWSLLDDLSVPEGADITPGINGTISIDWGATHLQVGLTTFSMYTGRFYVDGRIRPD